MRRCFTIGLVLVSLAAAARAGTFTVDDDGPANFSSIVAAVAAVSPGDVLLVMPGTYAGFFLGKPLTILGPGDGPQPRVTGTTIVKTSSFALAGLSLEHLLVSNVDGPARVDDCTIGQVTAGYAASLDVTNCGQLLVTRSVIDGHNAALTGDGGTGGNPSAGGVLGAVIRTSTYALVDCSVLGGDAAEATEQQCVFPSHGAAFLDTSNGQFTACSLVGGNGGISECTTGTDSNSGPGLTIQNGKHDLRGGTTLSAGPSFAGWAGTLGYALDVAQAILVIEPATVGTGGLKKSAALVLTAPAPELTLLVSATSPQVPGGFGQVTWTAPAGAPGVLLIAPGGPLLSFQKIEGTIWTAAPALLALPIVAGAGPTQLAYHLPPDDELIGAVITLQAFFPTVPGTLHPNKAATTNPTQLVIRF